MTAMLRVALACVLHDRRRYRPVVRVITIAGLMLVAQLAIAMGVFRAAAAPVARSGADLWVGPAGSVSLDDSAGLDPSVASALWLIPELGRIEPHQARYGEIAASRTGSLVDTEPPGSRYVSLLVVPTDAGGLLYARHLPAALRQALAEPGTIVLDQGDAAALGLAPGDRLVLDNRPLRLVGTVTGLQGLGLSTALVGRSTLPDDSAPSAPAYWLVSLQGDMTPERRAAIAAEIAATGQMTVWAPDTLQAATVCAYAMGSGAGTIFLASAALALAIAGLVVSQTMAAVVAGPIREYAALRAFGLAQRRLVALVLWQGAAVTVAAAIILDAASVSLILGLRWLRVPSALPWPLALATAGALVPVILLSNVLSLRHLRAADPAALLR